MRKATVILYCFWLSAEPLSISAVEGKSKGYARNIPGIIAIEASQISLLDNHPAQDQSLSVGEVRLMSQAISQNPLGTSVSPVSKEEPSVSEAQGNEGPAWETRHKLSTLGFGRQYEDPDHPVVKRVLEIAQEISAYDVLDLATGVGVTALALAQQNPHRRIVATDIDEAGLNQTRKKAQEKDLAIEVARLDASESWPGHYNRRFDIVVAKDVYPFLKPGQIRRFLLNAVDALRLGGLLLDRKSVV